MCGCGGWRCAPVAVVLLVACVRVATNCKLSEFACRRSSVCIPMNHVCDGIDHCGDRSDEHDGCSPCNRTYYGEVGHTYKLSIPRPRADRLPFVCSLTFVSNQYEMGDLVQLTLDDFKLGRFSSAHYLGCPDGHLQIEDGLLRGGQYCGFLAPDNPRPVYVSESAAVTATLRFFQFFGEELENNFSFRLRYKFLANQTARSRLGAVGSHLGERHDGAPCAYELTDCVSRACRIVSPNYPGMYPRNTTCTYRVHVRRADIPKGMYPLVVLAQPSSVRLNVQARRTERFGLEDRSIGLGADCDAVGDSVSVYDGAKESDPALLVFCRGSAIPSVVSSGPDMLVVLRTSPFGTPHLAPNSANGFELGVSVRFVREGEMRHAKGSKCKFDVVSTQSGSGLLRNVEHALPANASCRYRFLGRDFERVWITFLKFEVAHFKRDLYRTPTCENKLAMLDPKSAKSATEYCEVSPPRLCDHNYLQSQQTDLSFRACVASNESYLSLGPELTLLQSIAESTAVAALNFVIRYEFVDTRQDGEPSAVTHDKRVTGDDVDGGWSCHRVFSRGGRGSASAGAFSSPRNIFFYGRGGRSNLHCTYTFHGGPGERVKIEIGRFSVGKDRGACRSVPHPYISGHSVCDSEDSAQIWITELPDAVTPIRQHCICSEIADSSRPVVFLSNSSSLRVELSVRGMRPDEDFRNVNFSGAFSFVHEPTCLLRRVATGGGGELRLSARAKGRCPEQPWILQPSQLGRFIFLKMTGSVLSTASNDIRSVPRSTGGCASSARIAIFSQLNVTVVCPSGDELKDTVELFSDGWGEAKAARARTDFDSFSWPLSTVIVKVVSPENEAIYSRDVTLVQWLELAPTPDPSSLTILDRSGAKGGEVAAISSMTSSTSSLVSSSCSFACPELSGCIDARLWCDGVAHCPSGFDEMIENCAGTMAFAPLLYMYAVAAFACVVLVGVAYVVAQRVGQSRDHSPDEAADVTVAVRPPTPLQMHGSGSNGVMFLYGQQQCFDSITNLSKSAPSNGTLAESLHSIPNAVYGMMGDEMDLIPAPPHVLPS